jgi:hypothetical protein
MPPSPTRIKIALSAWLIAAALEAGIVVGLIHCRLLSRISAATLLLAVWMHALIFVQGSRRRKWAYGALAVLTPLSLLWWPLGKPLLIGLGDSSFPVVFTLISLRFGALALIRAQASQAWIESHTSGAAFWLSRKPSIVLGMREKLIQALAAILLGPALIGYVTGWSRPVVLALVAASTLLVALSLFLARKPAP